MTANELVRELKNLPPDTKVLLSVDPKGNGYSALKRCEGMFAYSDGMYAIEDLIEHPEVKEHGLHVVCLWPE